MVTGRILTYVRDDRPFGGHAPPAALYYASRDRKHEHPVQHLQAFTGILQADAYSGYNELYDPSRSQGAITAALCWHRCQCTAREERRPPRYSTWAIRHRADIVRIEGTVVELQQSSIFT